MCVCWGRGGSGSCVRHATDHPLPPSCLMYAPSTVTETKSGLASNFRREGFPEVLGCARSVCGLPKGVIPKDTPSLGWSAKLGGCGQITPPPPAQTHFGRFFFQLRTKPCEVGKRPPSQILHKPKRLRDFGKGRSAEWTSELTWELAHWQSVFPVQK